jgi:hypothetical protein
MQTEGVGGPCPRCDGMNCYVRKGSVGWYSAIACADCLFAYGEQSDGMLDETDGVVTGADVWETVVGVFDVTSVDQLREVLTEDYEFTVETPFNPDAFRENEMRCCVISESMLEIIIQAVQEGDLTYEAV